MLLMVIERFKDTNAVGARFRQRGRMLPEGVIYYASWVDPAEGRCFQVMEAPEAESLQPWVEQWDDLIEFEIIPILPSQQFWSSQMRDQ